ncbi:MAG: NAD(+)/NADH kinase [Firmicutes bacterium]|nr:NAD(+)/NADH kinase [Bacillota bacterium]
MFKVIGIYVNTDKDADMSCAQKMAGLLEKYGFEPLLRCSPGLEECMDTVSFIRRCEAVFVLGGDGTLLMVSKLCAVYSVPVLGINLGRVGFLSEVELSELDGAVARLAAGDYTVEQRMLLKCTVAGEPLYALNEIALHRRTDEHMINVRVTAGGHAVDSFYADGVLVASPTGSTAYNLSAGGPIAAPGAEVMLLTPISAHTLRARPYVFSSRDTLRVQTAEGSGVIAIDGVQLSLCGADGFTVEKAPFTAGFIRVTDKSFYQRLNSKLSEWSVK